jgi:hypothetical protein
MPTSQADREYIIALRHLMLSQSRHASCSQGMRVGCWCFGLASLQNTENSKVSAIVMGFRSQASTLRLSQLESLVACAVCAAFLPFVLRSACDGQNSLALDGP